MEKVIQYARGSVWYVNQIFSEQKVGLQNANRPCVIVSSDDGNMTNKTVVIALITSRDKAGKSINVPFINYKGEENVVLCNQLFTVSKDWLSPRNFGFMPKNLMTKIDDAIASALSINTQRIDTTKLEDLLVELINTKVKQNIIDNNNTEINNIIDGLYNRISSEVNKSLKEESKSIGLDIKDDAGLDKQKSTEETPKTNKTKISKSETKTTEKVNNTKSTRKPHGFWTDERKAEFVHDKETMELSALKEKWQMSNSKTIYQMYYMFKKRK